MNYFRMMIAAGLVCTSAAFAQFTNIVESGPAYAAVQGVSSGFNGMQNGVFARSRQLRRNLVATAHAIPHAAFLFGSTNGPAGARGPGDPNTIFGMHFWAQQYSGKAQYDRQGVSDGFTLNNNGSSVGLDKLIGEALVAGINYTYARSTSSASNGDHVETETYWIGLYGEYVNERGLYVDALLALARSNYESERNAPGYRGTARFRGSNVGGHIDVGNYFHSGRWALAPYVGLHYLWVQTDDYTEIDATGGQAQVDETKVASLESVVGLKLRNRVDTRIGRIQTTGYVEWMHDFLNEEIQSMLSAAATSVQTAGITPDENRINAGVGLGWTCTDYMEVGVGYDARFNENYEEHMGTLMLSVMF